MAIPDLNLLIALDILLDESSVTKAAERLHLSPPAMSRALAKIRELIGDPVLVRSGRNLVPTPRALELHESVKALVERAQQVFTPADPVDPSKLNRTFYVRTNDFSFGEIVRKLNVALQVQAPNCSLCIVPEGIMDDHALAEGRIDLYVSRRRDFSPNTKLQQLFFANFVGIAREDHPIFKNEITPESFAKYSQISISRRGRARGPIDQQLQTLGLTRHVSFVSPSLLASLFYLVNTDLILPTFPKHLVPMIQGMGLKLKTFELPVPVDAVEIVQAWHPRLDSDPGHQWFRRLVKDVSAEI